MPSREARRAPLFRYLVRLPAAGALAVALIGCTVVIDGGRGGPDPRREARAKWQSAALPALEASCVGCHNGSRATIGFLAGAGAAAIHDTLLAYAPPVVNLEATPSSRIVTKGQHDGPALTGEQAAALLEWLQAEREAQLGDRDRPVQVLATPRLTPQLCRSGAPDDPAGTCPVNHVALSAIPGAGASVPGAEITFVAEGLSSGLYLRNLMLHSGTAGVHLEHALFVSRPASAPPRPDPIDRYFALKLNQKPNAVEPIDGGTAQFGGFAPTDAIEIHFQGLSAFEPDATGGDAMQGGCKSLDAFKTNAVAQLKASCASCHAGADARATSAMNITGYDATDDAMALTSCSQVRLRVNLTTPERSGIYLAPDPASNATHPFKFTLPATFAAFKAAMDVWVNAEKTAP